MAKKRYSRAEFEGYKNRAIITLRVYNENHKIEFYTTNTNKNSTFTDILNFIKKGTDIRMVHWCSKEQDDLASQLIDKTFGYWERQESVKRDLEMDNKPIDNFYTDGRI